MGRELSELVVQLTFQHGNAASQIKQIAKENAGLETSFRASVAAMGGFTSSLDKATAESHLFTQQLELQKRATEQLRGELDGAKARMTSASQAYADQAQKVEGLRSKQTALKGEISGLKSAMDVSRAATGDNTEEYIGMSLKLDELNTALKENEKDLKAQELQLKKNDSAAASAERSVQSLKIQYDEAQIAQSKIQNALEATNGKLKRHVAQLEDASKKLKAYGDRTKEVGEAQSRLGQGMTAGITAPVLAAGGASVGAAIGWESDFAGVAKTVKGTPEDLQKINEQLLEMSTNIPSVAGDLATIGANAGQLGIATNNVVPFTRTIADLKETTNLTAEQGAQDFAKFANITKMPQTQFSNLGSTVVALGNNFATTESDTVAMGMNLAAAGTQANMTQAEIMGMSAALSSLGLEAQAGGTAFSRTITEMQVAVETGSKDLNDYAKVAGMSATEFATAFRTDAAGALSAFIAGLSGGTDSAVVMLDKMGVTETRTRDALLRASGAGDLLTDAISMANTAWIQNVALTNEANVRYKTTQSQITMTGNAVKAAAIKFGSDFLPAIQDGAEAVTDMAKKFGELDEATRKQIITFAGLAAAAGPTILAIGKGNEAVAAVATGLGKFTGQMAAAGGGVNGFVSALGGALGPVGVVALGAAVLVAGYKWYDYASGAQAAREATEAMIKTAEKWKETQATTIYDTGNDPFERFGLEKSDFGGGVDESKSWLDRLNQTWSDGKAETKQIVADYVNEFKGGSDKIREAIEARKSTQQKYGVTGDKTTEDDLKKLKAYDKEVEALLKKKQNGQLGEKEQQRLTQVIQERAEIQLKYTTGEGGGYDTIAQAVEAEKARLASEGKTGGSDLYGDALKAGAQGYQTQVDAINQSYRDQYTDIMAITDEKEREAALTQLNAEHQMALNKAKEDYNKLVGQYGPEAFQTPEVQKAQEQFTKLKEMIAQFQSGKITAPQLKTFTDSLDEGQLASYLALLQQLQQGGLGNLNLGGEGQPVITASSLLGGYGTVADYIKANAGTLTGLGDMLGAASDESNRVLVDMGLTPEGETLKTWIDEHKDFSLTGTLTGLPESITISATAPVTLTNLPTDPITVKADAPITITGLPDGPLTIPANVPTTLEGLPESATIQCTAPVTVTGLPESVGIPEAVIQDVTYAEGVAAPDILVKAKLRYDDFSGIEQPAIDAYFAENPSAKPNVLTNVGFQDGWAQALSDAYDQGIVTVWKDGKKLPLTPAVIGEVSATDVWAEGFDENGNAKLDIIITPKLGTKEAVDVAEGKLNEKPDNILPDSWKTSTADKVESIKSLVDGVKELESLGQQDMAQQGKFQIVDQLTSLNADDLKSIADSLASAMAALNSGTLNEEDAAKYQERVDAILLLIQTADEYQGVGNDVSAGIASGMTAYGWDGDAATLATNVETALRGEGAFASQSPARKMVPLGNDVAAGVGQGLAAYTFATEAPTAAANLKAAVEAALAENPIGFVATITLDGIASIKQDIANQFSSMKADGQTYGKNLVNGIIQGLEDKREDAKNKAKSIADDIREIIRKAWDINSPSKEGAWLGGMLIEGIGRGMDARIPDVIGRLNQLELRAIQPQAVPAARYREPVSGGVTVTGNEFHIRDDRDIHALAVELHALDVADRRAKGDVYDA